MIPSVPEMVNFLSGARKASRIVGGDVKDDVTEVSENLSHSIHATGILT